MTPYENKTTKEALREELTKLKAMSFKNKAWYIWEYYKIPIIGVVIGVSLCISIGMAMHQNRFDTALSCVIVNARPAGETDSVESWFNQDFGTFISLSPDARISVDYSMSFNFEEDSMSETTYAYVAKLTAMVSSRELDVMIADKAIIDHFGGMGGYGDLRELLPPGLYEQIKDRAYTVTDQESGAEIPCGLLIGGTDFGRKTGLILDEPILAVMSNSTRTDTAVSLISYLLGP